MERTPWEIIPHPLLAGHCGRDPYRTQQGKPDCRLSKGRSGNYDSEATTGTKQLWACQSCGNTLPLKRSFCYQWEHSFSVIFQTCSDTLFSLSLLPFRTNLTLTSACWRTFAPLGPPPNLWLCCVSHGATSYELLSPRLPLPLLSSWVWSIRGSSMRTEGRKRKSLRRLFLLIPFLLDHCLAVATFLQVTLSLS